MTTKQRPVRRPSSGQRKAPDVVYTPPKPFRRNRFLLHLATVLAVVLALILGMSIFFKVENVTVSGAQKYSAWDIREASGIQNGENLMTISRAKIGGRIKINLPYIEEVRVGIKLPNTVNIEVKELQVVYAIEATDNSWWLINASGKAVDEINASAAKAYSRIAGVRIARPTTGMQVVAEEPQSVTQPSSEPEGDSQTPQPQTPTPSVTGAQRLEWVISILNALEASGIIGEISTVDVSDSNAMELWYGQRYQIQLGDSSRIDYKIQMAKAAITQMGQHQSGVLDVSFTVWPDEVGYSAFS